MHVDVLQRLVAARSRRSISVLLTDIGTGGQQLLEMGDVKTHPAQAAIHELVNRRKSGLINAPDGTRLFVRVYAPPVRLIIVGAGEISRRLILLSRALDLEPVLIDSRSAFASKQRFPDVDVLIEPTESALPKLQIDRETAVVVVSHIARIDDPALEEALRAGCFYVGALGSKKTHSARLERLRGRGLAEDLLMRIRAPIGLAIGAATLDEIAVSILAEIVAIRRRGEILDIEADNIRKRGLVYAQR